MFYLASYAFMNIGAFAVSLTSLARENDTFGSKIWRVWAIVSRWPRLR